MATRSSPIGEAPAIMMVDYKEVCGSEGGGKSSRARTASIEIVSRTERGIFRSVYLWKSKDTCKRKCERVVQRGGRSGEIGWVAANVIGGVSGVG